MHINCPANEIRLSKRRFKTNLPMFYSTLSGMFSHCYKLDSSHYFRKKKDETHRTDFCILWMSLEMFAWCFFQSIVSRVVFRLILGTGCHCETLG
ncbi:hypothetical protein CEXT_365781 [Caerostris extrusa]|uniref:Uncharacterized protein n=1 Tax=Caerostris extrusa TaxID=172846 RepID=A0AAV4VCS4_CAEEX|nr:hypothetical protein CEXT_365781 [Caerostris extrusa]